MGSPSPPPLLAHAKGEKEANQGSSDIFTPPVWGGGGGGKDPQVE